MPTRLCLEAKCASPATYRGRCPTHNRTNEHNTNRAGTHIYNTKRWHITRRKVLFEQPICPGVYDTPCGHIAEHVHHITDIADGGDPWARDNLLGLCAVCHGKVTRYEQATR
jgi:5-methylcytosine-specific restriction endonuclease McrA